MKRVLVQFLIGALWALTINSVFAEQPVVAGVDNTVLAARAIYGTAPVILDVRTRQEFAAGHLPGAVNIPVSELQERFQELGLERNDELVVHCRSGKRAAQAEALLVAAGFTNVSDLSGHWLAWQSAGLPIDTE